MAAPVPEVPPVDVPQVAVSVLGPVQATVAGQPAALGGPRQQSVLARLVLAGGHVVSTDRLLEDLWDGEPPPRALASLQVHVSRLRRALEPAGGRRSGATVVVSVAPGYRLQLPREAVDAWLFEDLVARAHASDDVPTRHRLLEEALRCWSGPAYAGSADASWAAPEIARLEELRLVALELRADADLSLGRAPAVVPELERHLHDHPGREEAVRLLALALYGSGRQGDALAVLRRAREHLAEELGVDPGPRLRELEAAVLGQAPALDLPAPPVALPATHASTAPAPTPTPARAAELRQLLDLAAEGTRVVWVAGEAGAGKTTLVEAAAAQLRRTGWRVVEGRCPEVDGAPPAWPWTEITRALGGPPLREDTAFWLARAVADRLRDALREQPLLVVLDDVHRADELTLQLLRQVVDSLGGSPLLVLATYRDAEDGEALAATRAALASAGARHLQLRGLDADGIAVLARQHGLEDAGDEELRLLRERTDGNPLFVRELTRLLVAEGRGAARTGVPTGVRDVLRRRVERLPGPAVTALRQAAVLGREADVDVLAAVAGRDVDELLDALETAVLAGLLDEPAPGRVRFTHALVRDVLYEDTPLLRRGRVHAAALAVLRESGGVDAATLAHHAVAAAGPRTAADAVPYVAAAAREAGRLGAAAEEARQWASALRLLELAGRHGSAEELDVLLAAIPAHARAGDVVAARAQQRDAVRTARRLGRRDLLVAALAAWDAPLVWTVRDDGAQDPELLDPLLELLETPAGDDLPGDVRCRLLVALVREVEGVDDERTDAASAEAVRLARAATGPAAARLLCAALNVRAYAALGPHLAAVREPLAEELRAVASAAGMTDHRAVAHWLLFLAASARTDLVAARRHVDTAVALADAGQLGHVLGALQVFSGALLVLAGRPDEGRARYEQVAAHLVETGAMNGGLMALVGRFVAGFARGDLTPAVPELEWLHAAMPGALTDAVVLGLLDAGRTDDARAAWAVRRPISRDYYWLASTTLRAHAAARLGDLAVARQVRDELLPWAGRIAGLDSGTLVVGPVDDALAAVADALGDAGAAAAARRGAERVRAELAAQLAAVGV
ncbi:Transcriptional regulatory protein, C terminal [Geodermatophilus telluris]|uniref:Transcriptional regulatory protein, C terminal n=1 Tax=Geodermatophilus telluris TaxID=1190417 RepID=A0A1G6PCX6_9ACTN|nr:BTAD domain-containing putative transcriptional regulator [Geodermatophilus telluris]SDC77406.1 Transcriptional regulatory protein, C terminal [Geodermatophilus telluris]